VLALDNTTRFLPTGFRHVLVVGWWTVLGATVVSAIVEVWSTLWMERVVDEAADA
jgi:hypothetical protein